MTHSAAKKSEPLPMTAVTTQIQFWVSRCSKNKWEYKLLVSWEEEFRVSFNIPCESTEFALFLFLDCCQWGVHSNQWVTLDGSDGSVFWRQCHHSSLIPSESRGFRFQPTTPVIFGTLKFNSFNVLIGLWRRRTIRKVTSLFASSLLATIQWRRDFTNEWISESKQPTKKQAK